MISITILLLQWHKYPVTSVNLHSVKYFAQSTDSWKLFCQWARSKAIGFSFCFKWKCLWQLIAYEIYLKTLSKMEELKWSPHSCSCPVWMPSLFLGHFLYLEATPFGSSGWRSTPQECCVARIQHCPHPKLLVFPICKSHGVHSVLIKVGSLPVIPLGLSKCPTGRPWPKGVFTVLLPWPEEASFHLGWELLLVVHMFCGGW